MQSIINKVYQIVHMDLQTCAFEAGLLPLLDFLSCLVVEPGGVDLLEGLKSRILDFKLCVILLLKEKKL